jgi:tetratricopeptide (TPR) repeat protein
MTPDPLTRLAIVHGTDKIGYHDYTPNYFRLFRHLQDQPVRLLEIGVGGYQDADRGGESLEVWRDFFPNGRIVGIDIQKKEMDLGPRVSILQGSQVDRDFLEALVRDHGPFDIIIDDGSHRNEHVVQSFDILFPLLVPGGLYVVEDVQTAFFPRFGGSLDLAAPNSVGYFAEMFTRAALPDDVARMTRFHNMIALQKTGGDTEATAPLSAFSIPATTLLELGDGVLDRAGHWPDASVTRLGAGTALRRGDLKALKGMDAAGCDIVLDHSGTPDVFSAGFPALKSGGAWLVARPDTDLLHSLFVGIDHREIRVNFPDADLPGEVRDIAALSRTPECVVIEKGANDYPSNFAFDFRHPAVQDVLATMKAVLEAEGRERGMLRYLDMMTRAGDAGDAATMLDRLKVHEASSRAFFNMAVRQAKIDEDWDEAHALLDRAVSQYPDDARMRSQLGSLLIRERNWDMAATELRKAADLAPRDALIHIQLANALSRQDKPGEAVEIAALAVALAPEHAGFHVQLGRLQVNAGHLKDAVRTLKAALSLDPEIPNAHRQLSRALEALGRRDEALEVARQATDLFPENAEYQRWQERLEAA